MRYEEALKYLEVTWPQTAAWVERTIGPRTSNLPQVNVDLAVMSKGNHLSLVQCGLLIWIACNRPLNQPQNNWRGKSLAETQKMFLDMDEDALKAYLDDYEKSFAPAVQVPAVQVRTPPSSRPPGYPPPQPPRNPPQMAMPTGGLLQPRPPGTPPPQPPRMAMPTVGLSQPRLPGTPPPQPSGNPPRMVMPSGGLSQPRSPGTPPPQPSGNPPRMVMPSGGLSQPIQPAQTVATPMPISVPVPPRPRRMSKGPSPVSGGNQAEMMKWIEEMQDLKTILVCDIPTQTSGVYLTERNTGSLVDNAKINIAKTGQPTGWLNLGRGVLTNRMGKCWSCAAAVIYKIVTDQRFDRVRIESIGAKNYDHHFVVINRDPSTDVANMGTWNKDAILIDAWQANLTNWLTTSPDRPKQAQLCYGKVSDFPYQSEIKFFCAFEPGNRSEHQGSAGQVGKFIHAATVRTSWGLLKTCFSEHYTKNQKNKSCEVSGFCDKL
jgi:hypothetical protein